MRNYKHNKQELLYHLVLVTKYRFKLLNERIFFNINECELITIGGDLDHIHIEFKAHIKVKLWALIGLIKKQTPVTCFLDFLKLYLLRALYFPSYTKHVHLKELYLE